MYNTILVTKLQSKDLQQSLSELSAEGNYKISICNDVEEIIARMGPLQPDLIIASTEYTNGDPKNSKLMAISTTILLKNHN